MAKTAKEKQAFTVQLDKELYDEFNAFCEAVDIPKNTVVATLVRQMLRAGSLTVAAPQKEGYHYAVMKMPEE